MEKNDDSPEDVKRATSIEREIKRGEKDDAFEGYLHHEKKKRWEHCGKTSKKKKQKTKSNGDCCETRNGEKGKAKRFMKISVAGEPCTFPKMDTIPRHCLTKEDYIELLATPSRKCPPDCEKKTVLRRLRPISRRVKELAQPPRQRMLMSLQQGAAVLPPALLDNLARTLENETCLSPEQAAIVSRKKKLAKKRKEKNQTWRRQKETSKSSKPSMGTAIAGSLDKDAISCQYSMAERFVKSILRWKCPIPKSEFNDISKVIVERLVDVLEYTPSHNEDRKWQQLRALADMIACWMSGVLSDVARHQEEKLANICKKKAEEWAAAEEEEDKDEDEDEGEGEDEEEDEDEGEDEGEDEHAGAKEDEEGEEHLEEDSAVDTEDRAEDVTETETTRADEQDSKAVETEHVDTAEAEVETDQITAPEAEAETGKEGESERETGAETETETKGVTEEEEIDATLEADTEAETEETAETEEKAETPTTEELPADVTIESTEDDTLVGESLEEEEPEDDEEEEEEEQAEGEEEEEEEEGEEEGEDGKEKGDGDLPEGEGVETDVSATPLPGEKVTPEDEKWKDILVGGDLEELFKSDIPFVTFGKIIDTIYKMIECTPDNTGKDPITNAIHRVIYEKLTNIVMLEDPNLLTEEMKDVVDVVCGKIANWLKTILSKSQVAFMEECMPVVESKEIRDWTKWLERVSNEAIDWNIWLRGVIEKMFEMRCSKMTRGEWKDWTKSVDTGALLWRRFHLQTIHQAHRNITMMIGRRIVKTGTKTPCAASEQLIAATELQAR